jgi:hypothetical protein
LLNHRKKFVVAPTFHQLSRAIPAACPLDDEHGYIMRHCSTDHLHNLDAEAGTAREKTANWGIDGSAGV